MEIKVRDLDPVVVKKIDELAKKKSMSRNEYLKQFLSQYAIAEELLSVENKYENLVDKLSEMIEQSQDVIQINNHLLEKLAGHD